MRRWDCTQLLRECGTKAPHICHLFNLHIKSLHTCVCNSFFLQMLYDGFALNLRSPQRKQACVSLQQPARGQRTEGVHASPTMTCAGIHCKAFVEYLFQMYWIRIKCHIIKNWHCNMRTVREMPASTEEGPHAVETQRYSGHSSIPFFHISYSFEKERRRQWWVPYGWAAMPGWRPL